MLRLDFIIFLVSCFVRFFAPVTPTTFPRKTLGKPTTWPLVGDLTLTPMIPLLPGATTRSVVTPLALLAARFLLFVRFLLLLRSPFWGIYCVHFLVYACHSVRDRR
jgi:hypothetical protein